MKYLILPVRGQGDYDINADCALIPMSYGHIDEILARKARVCDMKLDDPDLYGVEYWDHAPRLLWSWDADIQPSSKLVVLDEEPEIKKVADADCITLMVCPAECYWQGHIDEVMLWESEPVSYQQLREILREQVNQPKGE
jgi:hypothetical protein